MNFEHPLTSLVVLTSIVSSRPHLRRVLLLIPTIGDGDDTTVVEALLIITCGTAAGAIIPELVKVFTSTHSRHVKEVVTAPSRAAPRSTSSRASSRATSRPTGWASRSSCSWAARTTSATWAARASTLMMAPAVFAFGLVAFGFLGMGPVTIAVDSYGPVTDNAQSVFELSTIETIPNHQGRDPEGLRLHARLREGQGVPRRERRRRQHLQGHGQARADRHRRRRRDDHDLLDHRGPHHGLEDQYLKFLSILHPPFLLGLITGGAVIYWFTGASTQAVSTGAYRAVEFIKANIKLEGSTKASVEDSQKVVTICTQYAQKGMFNIFLGVFFATLAFAFYESFFFIGYLVSIALFGLYQAIFMANAGGAWDNAKKIVETDPVYKNSGRGKGSDCTPPPSWATPSATPSRTPVSVAMNPVIKFTTLFGLLAVELAVSMKGKGDATPTSRGASPSPSSSSRPSSSGARSTGCASAGRSNHLPHSRVPKARHCAGLFYWRAHALQVVITNLRTNFGPKVSTEKVHHGTNACQFRGVFTDAIDVPRAFGRLKRGFP
jgi:K(+)-stimulated pyrophosphate-energized sodium pump